METLETPEMWGLKRVTSQLFAEARFRNGRWAFYRRNAGGT
jgi:hypothetical protein